MKASAIKMRKLRAKNEGIYKELANLKDAIAKNLTRKHKKLKSTPEFQKMTAAEQKIALNNVEDQVNKFYADKNKDRKLSVTFVCDLALTLPAGVLEHKIRQMEADEQREVEATEDKFLSKHIKMKPASIPTQGLQDLSSPRPMVARYLDHGLRFAEASTLRRMLVAEQATYTRGIKSMLRQEGADQLACVEQWNSFTANLLDPIGACDPEYQ